MRAKKLSVQVPPRVDRGPLVERREWWTMGKNKRNSIQSSHRTPIRTHFLCPSTCGPSAQAGDVDIFDDKISQSYPGAFAVGQKIAFGRRPSLGPLILRCLDVEIQFQRGDGLVRFHLGKSQLLHEVLSLMFPPINVLLHEGFHLIIHHSAWCYPFMPRTATCAKTYASDHLMSDRLCTSLRMN